MTQADPVPPISGPIVNYKCGYCGVWVGSADPNVVGQHAQRHAPANAATINYWPIYQEEIDGVLTNVVRMDMPIPGYSLPAVRVGH